MTRPPRAEAPTVSLPAQPTGPPTGPPTGDAGRGLTSAEVQERRARGAVNRVDQPTSRSAWAIVRANVLTRFNALLGALFVVVLVVGPLQDALFGLLMVVNSSIGIVTELRAKRTLDRFRVLTADSAHVVRDGQYQEVAVADVVTDDLVTAGPGDQVVADGVVVDAGGVELDESLLTGEADPVRKQPGDEVLSGSFVVAGTMHYRLTRVGADAYANRLAEQARTFTTPPSELQDGVNTILRWVTWALVPAAVILVLTQRQSQGTTDAIRTSVAAVTGMIPEGLVLLVSMAFSLAVVRVARRKVLVQQLFAVETLARVDVVCLDKTGTLTDGKHLKVTTIEPLDRTLTQDDVGAALAALAAADPSPNASLRAIAAAVPLSSGWVPGSVVPFSSGRRWSGADFGEHGAWVLGAPEVFPARNDVTTRVEAYAREGLRVVLLARAERIDAERGLATTGLRLAAMVALQDRIRPDAAATVRYFAEQGVALKVLSGDHPQTVAAIARAVGIDPGGEPVNATGLADDQAEVARLLAERSVLGRVAPQQKQRVIEALQSAGHSVAMIGDGVNDVPGMKSADLPSRWAAERRRPGRSPRSCCSTTRSPPFRTSCARGGGSCRTWTGWRGCSCPRACTRSCSSSPSGSRDCPSPSCRDTSRSSPRWPLACRGSSSPSVAPRPGQSAASYAGSSVSPYPRGWSRPLPRSSRTRWPEPQPTCPTPRPRPPRRWHCWPRAWPC